MEISTSSLSKSQSECEKYLSYKVFLNTSNEFQENDKNRDLALSIFIEHQKHQLLRFHAEKEVWVNVDTHLIPHPEKRLTGGEDALFVSADKYNFGVADGVGGWSLSVCFP